jgi:hypothetical protein
VSSDLCLELRFAPGSGKSTPCRRMHLVSCANAARSRVRAAGVAALEGLAGLEAGSLGEAAGLPVVAVGLAGVGRVADEIVAGGLVDAGACGGLEAPGEVGPDEAPHAASAIQTTETQTSAAHSRERWGWHSSP